MCCTRVIYKILSYYSKDLSNFLLFSILFQILSHPIPIPLFSYFLLNNVPGLNRDRCYRSDWLRWRGGPVKVDKVNVPGKLRLRHQFAQRRFAELEANDVEDPVPLLDRNGKVFDPLLKGVFGRKLGFRVDRGNRPVLTH